MVWFAYIAYIFAYIEWFVNDIWWEFHENGDLLNHDFTCMYISLYFSEANIWKIEHFSPKRNKFTFLLNISYYTT